MTQQQDNLPPISEEEIALLEELEKKSSRGSWPNGPYAIMSVDAWQEDCDVQFSKEDCDFIEMSKAILPRLLKEWREMKEKEKTNEYVAGTLTYELNRAIDSQKEAQTKLAQKDAVIEKMKECLRFYAESKWNDDYPGGISIRNANYEIYLDTGDMARKCLEEIKGG